MKLLLFACNSNFHLCLYCEAAETLMVYLCCFLQHSPNSNPLLYYSILWPHCLSFSSAFFHLSDLSFLLVWCFCFVFTSAALSGGILLSTFFPLLSSLKQHLSVLAVFSPSRGMFCKKHSLLQPFEEKLSFCFFETFYPFSVSSLPASCKANKAG